MKMGLEYKMNKPLCELTGCPSVASKTIGLRPLIDQFIVDASKNNPGANPLCIKRIVSKLLTEESARLFVELMETQNKRVEDQKIDEWCNDGRGEDAFDK